VRTKEGTKNVKKTIGYIMALCCVMFILSSVRTYAQCGVMDRKAVTLPATTGTGTWTQNVEVANIELRRLSIKNALNASDTCTVTRVTGETIAETNTVATLLVVSNAGNTNLVHAVGGPSVYLKRNDKLTFAMTGATGATAYVEYLIQTR
jgi:hypothetical protein